MSDCRLVHAFLYSAAAETLELLAAEYGMTPEELAGRAFAAWMECGLSELQKLLQACKDNAWTMNGAGFPIGRLSLHVPKALHAMLCCFVPQEACGNAIGWVLVRAAEKPQLTRHYLAGIGVTGGLFGVKAA
ncbi:MAG: hypothetical protein JSS27_18890 [Planctomycetes bacterium]|nr:hypothetical protein [Planctomycetota bacterium]